MDCDKVVGLVVSAIKKLDPKDVTAMVEMIAKKRGMSEGEASLAIASMLIPTTVVAGFIGAGEEPTEDDIVDVLECLFEAVSIITSQYISSLQQSRKR